jgi:hypothetical protein
MRAWTAGAAAPAGASQPTAMLSPERPGKRLATSAAARSDPEPLVATSVA